MKIAIITNEAASLLNFRGPLMADMVAAGHEVLALSPDHDDTSRAALAGIGVQAVDCPMSRSGTNPLRELGTILRIRRALRLHRPDLSFGYFIKPVIYGTLGAAMAGVPQRFGLYAGLGFAFTDEAAQGARRRLLQRVIAALARLSARFARRIMFQNPDDMAEFIARGIVGPDKAVLVGATGVDLGDWAPAPLPEGPVTFVLAARLLRDKGIGEYAEAARLVRQTHPQARFLLLGKDDHNPAAIPRPEVEGWVREGLIEWPGHVPVRPWLAQAHVFVLPSYREGVPRSTQEAMAMGRAIITTDAPGCRETVVDGANGLLVPVRDAPALATAMRRLADDPALVAAMGVQSRRLAEERFDVRRQNRRMLDVMGL
ncbi:MAG: glycosyltransferase family 4 protein [Rubellimicrobium sp.]|nr:glycosyltransferase family 4 protein [Rubellimicrobium sp.]